MNFSARLTILMALYWGFTASADEPFDHTHRPLTSILSRSVKSGLVNYASLKTDPRPLDLYLSNLARVNRAEFERWKEPQRIAFLLNLYNATTLRLVRDHYPVASIRKIGGVFQSPWKLDVVELFGKRISLDHLEHEMLRKDYHEPRIHFALVCAARSCPTLRAEAYEAERLDAQMRDQGIRFLARSDQNRVDPATGTLWLSEIFKWFEADFLKESKSLQEFVMPFLPPDAAKVARAKRLKVRFADYDWSLNSG